MKHKLKDRRVVEIVPLSAKVPAKWLMDYINGIIEEDGWIHLTKRQGLKEEEAWKKNTLAGIKKGEQLHFAALYGERVVGSCHARREAGRNKDNIMLGIAVSRDFRREGLGEFLMKHTISKAKRKWKPKNIYLNLAAPNKRAMRLYEKIGFVEFARFPNWVKRRGKYYDFSWMLLK